MLIQPNGKIVAGGVEHAVGSDSSALPHYAVARLNSNLSLDTAFGSGGKVMTNQAGSGGNSFEGALLRQPDDQLIVVTDTTARYFP